MEALISSITLNHILLLIILVIVSIWLRSFEPPLKQQWQAIIMFTFAGTLGYFMINNIILAIAISGLVFYKNVLVEELLLIKESIKNIDDIKDELKNNKKEIEEDE